jgi:alanyl-tRNA synthetase
VAAVRIEQGSLNVGDKVWVGYEAVKRLQTRAHHSATHLLHHALRKVLGEHVKQAGSLVDAEHLRFDFSHFSSVTPQELVAIEDAVNAAITAHTPVAVEELHIDEARNKGAVALFGEKYGERVRVISMGESIEFCGGTHARNTQDLGMLLITREQAVQSGVRRLEAEVGDAAHRRVQLCQRRLAAVAQALGAEKLAQTLGQIPSPEDDAELGAVLTLVERCHEQLAGFSQILKAQDGPVPVVTPQALGVDQAWATGPLDLDRARSLRDTWAALVQLAQGRAQDGPAILSRLAGRDVGHLAAATVNLMASVREADREAQALTSRDQAQGAKDVAASARTLASGLKVVTHLFEAEGINLKDQADHIRAALGSGVVALAGVDGQRVTLLVALTPDLVGRLSAGALIRAMAPHVDGKGGGRPDMAQAGGRKPDGVAAAFEELERQLSAP